MQINTLWNIMSTFFFFYNKEARVLLSLFFDKWKYFLAVFQLNPAGSSLAYITLLFEFLK
jgi:hypothetical protein